MMAMAPRLIGKGGGLTRNIPTAMLKRADLVKTTRFTHGMIINVGICLPKHAGEHQRCEPIRYDIGFGGF